MISPQDPINLQNTALILAMSFFLAVIAAGVFIRRTSLFDRKRPDKKIAASPSGTISKIAIACGSIFFIITLMMFLVNLTKL